MQINEFKEVSYQIAAIGAIIAASLGLYYTKQSWVSPQQMLDYVNINYGPGLQMNKELFTTLTTRAESYAGMAATCFYIAAGIVLLISLCLLIDNRKQIYNEASKLPGKFIAPLSWLTEKIQSKQ